MNTKISILGFAGSLRRDSYNRAILRAAAGLVPENAELSIFDLEGIPPFNQVLEKEPPEKVKDFKAKIKAADAILIATPAYAHGTGPGHIDEGPSPGTVITIIMVVAWILIALGVVFFVRSLIRRRTPNNREETNKK